MKKREKRLKYKEIKYVFQKWKTVKVSIIWGMAALKREELGDAEKKSY